MARYDKRYLVDIPGGKQAIIAQYQDHKLPEYNANPMIQALPPILSAGDFAKAVTTYPHYNPQERNLEAHHRFHCIERLSRYFDPLNKTVELQQVICVLLMQGYLARNPIKPDYVLRSHQIYQAVQAGGGKHLEDYVCVPTSASGLTLIGASGIGKSTNLINILKLYPQIIVHPDYSVYQLVWLKVDCPHAGSLKGLCIDIFLAVDLLLGTDYFDRFGSTRNSEDYMLAQVAQIAHTHHLGMLAIDEIQNLATARRSCADMLNFLVKLDNTIGVPVIRVGTNEAFPILQGNFRNARRGTGEGGVYWERMKEDGEWEFFMEGMWEFQWTKTPVPFSQEISQALYEESQGIIDIAIKLYKMLQWKVISLGNEEIINTDLIHQVAKKGMYLVKPMLDAIRSGNEEWMVKYKDIAPLNTTEYKRQCLSDLESKKLTEIRKLARKQHNSNYLSPTLRHVILELLKLEIEPTLAKECAQTVLEASNDNEDISKLVKEAYTLALQGGKVHKEVKKSKTKKRKRKPQYQDQDVRMIVEKAKENKTAAYEALKLEGVIQDNLVQQFITIN